MPVPTSPGRRRRPAPPARERCRQPDSSSARPWRSCGSDMVLAISFLETPLKFRAPGITVPLGLGIGRLVFRALNTVEVVLAAALITALLTVTPGAAGWTLLVVTVALLATQAVLLRPRLDRRAQKIICLLYTSP